MRKNKILLATVTLGIVLAMCFSALPQVQPVSATITWSNVDFYVTSSDKIYGSWTYKNTASNSTTLKFTVELKYQGDVLMDEELVSYGAYTINVLANDSISLKQSDLDDDVLLDVKADAPTTVKVYIRAYNNTVTSANLLDATSTNLSIPSRWYYVPVASSYWGYVLIFLAGIACVVLLMVARGKKVF